MHFLQPIADLMAPNWWVWLICMLISFAIRVRLVPKPGDNEEQLKDSRFLRGAVEFAMWMFGLLLIVSLMATAGQLLNIW